MASENTAKVQAGDQETNEPQLGSFDALSTLQNQPVYPWLDQLLWYRQLLSTLRGSGSLDTASSQDGILASVAKATHQSKKPDETRG